MTLFFEDFTPGTTRTFGGHTVTADDIIAFARQFDPQPFHLDESVAKASPYGGLIASGWHTASLCMRMCVDDLLGAGTASLGSPGVDRMRWLKPVRPGDTLRVDLMVVAAKPSSSRPDRGSVTFDYAVKNQRDEVVMTMTACGIFLTRAAGALPEAADNNLTSTTSTEPIDSSGR